MNPVIKQSIGRYILLSGSSGSGDAQVSLNGDIVWEGDRKRVAQTALKQSVYDAELGEYPKASAVFLDSEFTRNLLWEKLPEQAKKRIESELKEKIRKHSDGDMISGTKTFGEVSCLLQYFIHPELGIDKAIIATISFAPQVK